MTPDAAALPVPMGTHLFRQDLWTHPSLQQRQLCLPKDALVQYFLPSVSLHSPALAGSPPWAPRASHGVLLILHPTQGAL